MEDYIFGANILENLTTGMYKDSKVSYREYIQNACDQIDKAVEEGLLGSINEGIIDIWVDADRRIISIEDNATGIPTKKFEATLANIADSSKHLGTDKGFRGIGRLCGLAYCQELVFTSTAYDEETVSIMRCDAQKMREYLNRNVNGEKYTASDVLSKIYKFEYVNNKARKKEHSFKVELIGVNDENRDLLDFEQVKNYLSFTAPVPYKNTFPYKREIHDHAKKIGYRIDEYRIRLNGEEIFKKYSTQYKTSKGDDEIFDVEFKDFYDESNNLIMWLWFGVSTFKAIISKECQMRGLRLRKENIQIGNEDALQPLFKEDRGQHYYVGELFAVSKELIPNSQRDYFNETKMRVWFEKEIRKYFQVLHKIYHDASDINSSFNKIDSYEKKTYEHQEKLENNNYVDAEHIQKATDALNTAQNDAIKAQEKIEKIKNSSEKTEANAIRQKVIKRIEKERKKVEIIKPSAVTAPAEPSAKPEKQPRRVDKLSRCSKQERKLIGKIYNIIFDSTDEKTAEIIINKIEEEFK